MQAKCSIMPAPTARLHPLALTQRQRLLYGSATNVVETGGSINFFSDWGRLWCCQQPSISCVEPMIHMSGIGALTLACVCIWVREWSNVYVFCKLKH